MPWVDQSKCTLCGTCMDECVVDAIVIEDDKTIIDMNGCIRCGTCHSVCPEGAVRHDAEIIPQMIEDNLSMTRKNMDMCVQYLGDEGEKEKCLQRMIKHFNKEKIVAERTLEELGKMKEAK